MLHEVELLQSIDHPHVVRCYGSFWKAGIFYMVIELCERGDVSKMIADRVRKREPFSEEEVWDMFMPVAKVAAFLHEKGIIHRDIKALNVFVSRDGTIKVGDFGVGRQLSENTLMVDTMYGTPLYLSPELCESKPYNEKTDIWSLGVLLYELCCLKTPFSGRNLVELAKNIVGGKYEPLPDRFSPVMQKAVRSLLCADQNKRPSAATLLAWLEEVRGGAGGGREKSSRREKGEARGDGKAGDEHAAAAADAAPPAATAAGGSGGGGHQEDAGRAASGANGGGGEADRRGQSHRGEEAKQSPAKDGGGGGGRGEGAAAGAPRGGASGGEEDRPATSKSSRDVRLDERRLAALQRRDGGGLGARLATPQVVDGMGERGANARDTPYVEPVALPSSGGPRLARHGMGGVGAGVDRERMFSRPQSGASRPSTNGSRFTHDHSEEGRSRIGGRPGSSLLDWEAKSTTRETFFDRFSDSGDSGVRGTPKSRAQRGMGSSAGSRPGTGASSGSRGGHHGLFGDGDGARQAWHGPPSRRPVADGIAELNAKRDELRKQRPAGLLRSPWD